jgi:hypothetical protein
MQQLTIEDLGHYLAIGILSERNGLGLTANEAEAVGLRIATRLMSERDPIVGQPPDNVGAGISITTFDDKKPHYAPGIDGGVCRICGGMLIRTGPCRTCTECGNSDGCG